MMKRKITKIYDIKMISRVCISSGSMFEFNTSLKKRLTHTFMDRCGRDRMVVGFMTTYAIIAYQH